MELVGRGPISAAELEGAEEEGAPSEWGVVRGKGVGVSCSDERRRALDAPGLGVEGRTSLSCSCCIGGVDVAFLIPVGKRLSKGKLPLVSCSLRLFASA